MTTEQANIEERTESLFDLMATVYVENIIKNEQNTTKETEYTRRPIPSRIIGIGNYNGLLEREHKSLGRTLWQPMEKLEK
jgi:hypothetical protein